MTYVPPFQYICTKNVIWLKIVNVSLLLQKHHPSVFHFLFCEQSQTTLTQILIRVVEGSSEKVDLAQCTMVNIMSPAF